MPFSHCPHHTLIPPLGISLASALRPPMRPLPNPSSIPPPGHRRAPSRSSYCATCPMAIAV
eukprot:11182354-Lingulodinium_polyedra.AAC.1